MSGPGRLILALLACAYLLGSFGVVGRFVTTDAGARPASSELGGEVDFPCAHHVCGCVDAETCRTSCCCFPRPDAACAHCADESPAGSRHHSSQRAGPVIRCSCPLPVAFAEGQRPLQDRRHESFRALVLDHAGRAAPPSTGRAPAGFLEPASRVPIAV